MEASHRVPAIRQFYRQHQRMPTVRELQRLCGFQSPRAAAKLATRLIALGFLAKDPTGKLLPSRSFRETRILGTIEAGFPSPAEEELSETMDLDEFLIQNKEATYLLKVTGDSMIEAGIMPGDMVLAERGLEPHDGDIVIAQIDQAWTMKYFRKWYRKAYLEPANPKYKRLYPQEELKVEAVVIGVLRKYRST